MTEPQMHWPDLVEWSKEHNLLAKRLYVVTSVPTNGLGPILENIGPHVAYQTRLENDGIMFAAGPRVVGRRRAGVERRGPVRVSSRFS